MTLRKQQGAAAAIAALQAHRARLESGGPEETAAEHFAAGDSALDALLAAAGPMPARAEGAYRALAELLIFNAQKGGEADLAAWRPEATMTAHEREAHRAGVVAAEAAGWGLAKPGGKVLPFPARRESP